MSLDERRRRPSPTSVCAALAAPPRHQTSSSSLWSTLCAASLRLLDAAFHRFGHAYPLNLLLYALTLPVAELCFYWHCRHFARVRSAAPHDTFAGASDTTEVLRFWDRLLAEEDAAALWKFLRGWFLGEGEPRHDDLVGFVVWTLYNCERPRGPKEFHVVEDLVRRIEAALGRALEPGRAPRLRCMLYTLEPFARCHKPLGYYLALQTAHRCVGGALGLLLGFRRERVGRLHYLVRPAAADSAAAPVVLIHGVGGLLPYPLLIRELAARHAGPVLLPLLPHGALDALPTLACARRAMPTAELVDALGALVARHAPEGGGPQRAAFVGHSLGTAALAALVKARPQLVAAALFADPICFLLHRSDVLHNFMYAAPALGRATWFHWIQHRVMTSDPTVQNCFRKEFWWAHFSLHPARLTCPTLVLLSGADTVCNPRAVAEHLRKRGPPSMEVQLAEGPLTVHGARLCLFPRARRAAVDALQRLLAEGLAPRAGGGDGVCAPAHDAGAEAETASSLFPRSESLGSTCSWETLCFAEESSA